MDFYDSRWESMDWIHMADARDMGQALANMIRNLHIP
jgi:hypothetical protein